MHNILDELLSHISSGLPQPPSREVRDKMRAVLRAALDRMELVTREEFEVQQAVLAKTRQKLEDLEQTVAELEKKLVKQNNKE